MKLFLEFSGILFWLCMIAAFVEFFYTKKHKFWMDVYYIRRGKKFTSWYSDKPRKKRSVEFRDVLPDIPA